MQVVDTGKDLNAYAKVENQSACCSPPMSADNGVSLVSSCCSAEESVHENLAKLLRQYDVNDFAASVQVYALKKR